MLVIKNLHKQYLSKSGEVHQALRGIDLEIGNKGFIVLLGKSGSGKSTLLNMLGGLDQFDSGEILVNGKSTKHFKANEWDSYRNTYVGFVFQAFYIIDEFTIGKNIALSLELQGLQKDLIDKRVEDILRSVDLEGYKDRKSNEISGGQKQRISIARALIKDPQIILADEPTGNLDSVTGTLILDELKKLSKEKLVILVTHDEDFARIYGDRIIELKDGLVINDSLYGESIQNPYQFGGPVASVIKLQKGQPLSQDMIESINKELQKHERPFIGLSRDETFISSLIPIKTDESPKTTEIKSMTVMEEASEKELILRPTSLSIINAFKLALSSLITRKVRLFFMLLLFTVSLLFVGVATNFSFYNASVAANLTFENTGIRQIPIEKQEKTCTEYYDDLNCYYEPVKYTAEDAQSFNDEYSTIDFVRSVKQVGINHFYLKEIFNLSEFESTFYYDSYINKITLIDGAESYIPLVSGIKKSLQLNEVYITDYHANLLIEYKAYQDVFNIEDIVGKTFIHDYHTFTIQGIVDTNYEVYDDLKDMRLDDQSIRATNFEENQRIWYQQIFMTEDTYEQLIYQPKTAFLTFENEDSYNYIFAVTKENVLVDDYLIGNSRLPETRDEIVVTLAGIQELGDDLDTITIDDMSAFIGTTITKDFVSYDGNNHTSIPKSYTIVGVVDTPNNFEPRFEVIMHPEELVELFQVSERKYDIEDDQEYEMIALLGNNDKENIKFFSQLREQGFNHTTRYSFMLQELHGLTTRPMIFFYIGAVFTVFAALLVYSFVSSSIKLKQTQIGTLRAIGARGVDVSKIFLIEGLIIALLVSVLTNVSLYFVIRFFNDMIVSSFKVPLVLLYMNFFSVFIILFISIVVVMLSIYIPLKRITKMKPINAIKNTVN